MENKINIAELLRDCPKGMELYSPLCGKCVFDRLNMGTIICKKENTQEITFTSKGYYMLPVFDDCECMIFPSKDQRDWNKFQRPFKDGDILITDKFPFVYKNCDETGIVKSYCGIDTKGNFWKASSRWTTLDEVRFATEEEKQKLFNAIRANGYKWNPKTKTLEKLITPKFKIGDRIKYRSGEIVYRIVQITEDSYVLDNLCSIPISIEHMYNLVPNKFDINTLKPFEDKVLVRNDESQRWLPAFWGYKVVDGFITTSGWCKYCIPYNGNETLFKTNNDCDDFYKTWEK